MKACDFLNPAEVGIICDEFMAAIEKITSSKRPKWITNRAGQKVPDSHATVEILLSYSLRFFWEDFGT